MAEDETLTPCPCSRGLVSAVPNLLGPDIVPPPQNVLLLGRVLLIMSRGDKNEGREERIRMEAVVDAYGAHERALGWYYYLERKIRFPFEARCIEEREVSPLEEDEAVQVEGMSSVEACRSEMFVTVDWMNRELGIPLAQLEPIEVESETEEAVADWHYWTRRGYEF